MYFKIGGFIASVLLIAALWFWIGSLIVGLIINTDSNMLVFALVLLMWWYLRASCKLFDIITNQTETIK